MPTFCVPLRKRKAKRTLLIPPEPSPYMFCSPDGKHTVDCSALRAAGEPVVVFFSCGCDLRVLDSLDYASYEEMQARGRMGKRLRVIVVPTLALCEQRWKHLIDANLLDSLTTALRQFRNLDVFLAATYIQQVPAHPLVRKLIEEGRLEEEEDMPIMGQTFSLFQEPTKDGWHFLDAFPLLNYGSRCQARVMRPSDHPSYRHGSCDSLSSSLCNSA